MNEYNMSIICERGPKRLDIVGLTHKHLYYRTTGLPKGRKVLGDGAVIVAAHARGYSKRVDSVDTNIVMDAEREVLQPCNPPVNKCLATGMKKLVALGELSKTQKVKV